MRKNDQGKTPCPPFPDLPAAPQDFAKPRLRSRVLLLGCDGKPIHGKTYILVDADPLQIEAAKPILRLGVPEIARRVAEQIRSIGRVGWKRHGWNAVEIIPAKSNESLSGIVGDGTRWADIGPLVGDLFEIEEGLGVVFRHLPARGIGAGKSDLSPQHAALGGIFEGGQRNRRAPRLQRLHALAIGLGR